MPKRKRADSSINPIARQGAMDVMADRDIQSIADNADEARQYQQPPPYPAAAPNDPKNMVVERELVFRTRGSNKRRSKRLDLLSNLNGMGSRAASEYSDPEMIRQSIKNGIQYMGVAVGTSDTSRQNQRQGLAFTMAGLNTIYRGNLPGSHGAGPQRTSNVMPGDIVVAEPSLHTAEGASGTIRQGIPPGKYTLVPVVLDPASSGDTMLFHIRKLLDDGDRWSRAMGPKAKGTTAWMTGAKKIVDSSLVSATLGLSDFIASGLVVPSPEFIKTMSEADQKAIQASLENSPLKSGTPAQREDSYKARHKSGDTVSVYVAEYMRLIKGGTREAGLAPPVRKAMRELRMNMAQRIFRGGSHNLAYEFGYVSAGKRSSRERRGVYPQTGKVRTNNAYGEMLSLQMNHASSAISGFHHAIQDQTRNTIGKATSSGVEGGSDRFNVALGIARP